MTGPAVAGKGRAVARRWRRKFRYDPQPTDGAKVLLASTGRPFSPDAVDAAIRLSDGDPVAVVTIARIYGSAWGLPNPGLMPTRKELDAQERQIRRARQMLRRAGRDTLCQVAVSRRPEKTIAKVAAARQVSHVVMDAPRQPLWRRLVEGDSVRAIQRRVGQDVVVHPVVVG